jgi:hypothetical protein
MHDSDKTARDSRSANGGPLTKLLLILLLISTAVAGMIGVCATGTFDWRIQQLIADHGEKNLMNIDNTDNSSSYFSEDYFIARKRFIESGRSAGAVMDQLPITERGPKGELLTIDIAWLGSQTPKTVLLHTSGVHGVEGFAGSAIQLKILEMPPKPPTDTAIIIVHALNPYGMAWLRRYNETNVDLNRNFRFEPGAWHEDSYVYAQLDSFLNPKKYRFFDSFLVQALFNKLRYGEEVLRNAIPTGQNFNPKGLFYCGHQVEEGPKLFSQWLRKSLSSAEYVFVIDVHTGLGRKGQESLFHKIVFNDSSKLSRNLDRQLERDYATSGVAAYSFKGAYSEAYTQFSGSFSIDFVTQEFGTYSNLYVLHALRDENRSHHLGDRSRNSPSKQQLREAFNPDHSLWQAKVISDGVSLFERSTNLVFNHKM